VLPKNSPVLTVSDFTANLRLMYSQRYSIVAKLPSCDTVRSARPYAFALFPRNSTPSP
jgi:hypothetical protein